MTQFPENGSGRLARRLRLGLVLLLAGVAAGQSGCITAAVTATVMYVKGTMEHTATVKVQATPADTYAAMLRILERRPDVTVDKRDDDKRELKLSKGKNKATARVKEAESGAAGMTELTVTAREGETDQSHEELALSIVQQVCDELGVPYEVVEKKGLLRR